LLGGFLVLFALYILVAGFWAPRGVQFLNGIVCEDGRHLDNHGDRPSGGDTDSIELTCRGPRTYVNAMPKMLSVAGASVVAGACCFALSRRYGRPRIAAPQHVPPHL
jgi:hypothetical protein